MGDLSEYIKNHLYLLHKKKSDLFGTVQERVMKMNTQRKQSRLDDALVKRRIPENMSPIVTPVPKRNKREERREPADPGVNKRLEMLKKWKTEKEKRKEVQKKTSKPIFKVSHVSVALGLPKLEMVNREIKGKPFKSKFAPPNHKFHPPPNIQPIYFDNKDPQSSKNTSRDKKTEKESHKMVTRSQARATSALQKNEAKVKTTGKKTPTKASRMGEKNKTREDSDLTLVPPKQPVTKAKSRAKTEKSNTTKEKNVKHENSICSDAPMKTPVLTKSEPSSTVQQDKIEETNENKENIDLSLISPDYPVANIQSTESDEVQTPIKVAPPTYISPFVTISRGKNSARKEYVVRKLGQSFSSNIDTPDYTSPKAGAVYFTWLLDSEISRLKDMCDQWTTYKNEMDPPEEAVSMIDVALGQTNLLITKKFEQFRGLIHKCQSEPEEALVTCEDLHGFWDMMHLQVNNLDKRFANLDNLKANNWQEIIPEVKKDVKKKSRKPKTVKASSALREAIQAARKKKQENPDISLNKSNKRVSVMQSEEKKKRISSPGLLMMKVAQFGKNVETPAKSILKETSVKSNQKSQQKSVLFHDEVSVEIRDTDLHNSGVKTPIRRSERLSKGKLF
nr:PREDICTED: disks large-associated protein 5 isoform X1 [Tribolium castaneum]|eukprot:XP_015840217.1 PREDICTED: disks large-associated protein 5 isoform X1 [Tribolium castaneum]